MRPDGPLSLALALALVAIPGCRLPNEDHCLHKDEDANAWCAQRDASRPFCSPCEVEQSGCVTSEPTEATCPDYSAPAPDTDTGTGTESDTDTGS